VLDRRLSDREFIAGDTGIADLASYSWIVRWQRQQQNLDDFPNLKRWFELIQARPAVARAYLLAKDIIIVPMVTENA